MLCGTCHIELWVLNWPHQAVCSTRQGPWLSCSFLWPHCLGQVAMKRYRAHFSFAAIGVFGRCLPPGHAHHHGSVLPWAAPNQRQCSAGQLRQPIPERGRTSCWPCQIFLRTALMPKTFLLLLAPSRHQTCISLISQPPLDPPPFSLCYCLQ